MSIQAAIKAEYDDCNKVVAHLEGQLQNAKTQSEKGRILVKLTKKYKRIAELELLRILPSVSREKPRAKRKKL